MSAGAPWVRHPMVADASAGAVPERAHLSSIGQNSAVGGRASVTEATARSNSRSCLRRACGRGCLC
jgi:hypothetical protein